MRHRCRQPPRACDVLPPRVDDRETGGHVRFRTWVMRQEPGHPVQVEITEPTRDLRLAWIRTMGPCVGVPLYSSRKAYGRPMGARQYPGLVDRSAPMIGPHPREYDAHANRRAEASLICRRTGRGQATQRLFGHAKLERAVRHLGVEVDDAPTMAGRIDARARERIGQTIAADSHRAGTRPACREAPRARIVRSPYRL